MEQYSDEQLVYKAKRGDDDALQLLISRYLKLVYNFSFRYISSNADAEDITQVVFIKVWKKLHSFDEAKSFKPWLYEITKNTCLDFLKKKSALAFSLFDTEEGNPILDSLADTTSSVDERVDEILGIEKVTSAMKTLSPKSLEAVSLYHREQLTFREISQRLRAPLHTVKSRYRRAMIELKRKLKSS